MYQYPTGCWLGRGFPTNIQLVGWVGGGVLNQYPTGWVGGWKGYPISIQLVAGLLGGRVFYHYPTGCWLCGRG